MATIGINEEQLDYCIIEPVKEATKRLDGFVRLEARRNRRTIKRAMRKSTYRNNKWKRG